MCEAFVDALGLKTLFSAFMGKVRPFHAVNVFSSHTHPVVKETEVRASSPCI